MILCASPLSQFETQREEIQAAIQRVLDSGYYVLGTEVKAFEAEFAAFTGTKHCIGVGNGTDAIQIALSALGVGPGDEVITVAHTAVATASAIVQAGAKPVFVDVHPVSYTIDPAKLGEAITARTKAIVAVHIYGHPVDLAPVLELAKSKGLSVIEDCAQAHGAAYEGRAVGSMGDVSCFSFYPTKNLGAIGDGGAVCTNSDTLAEKMKLLRQYGWAERYVSKIHGWNTRLDELQAAILRVKLRRLAEDNLARARLASRYSEGLAGTRLKLPQTRPGSDHVFHLYAVCLPDRDKMQQFLLERKVQALVHYPVPIHLQPGYAEFHRGGSLVETERLSREELSLPIYPALPIESVDQVIQAIRAYL